MASTSTKRANGLRGAARTERLIGIDRRTREAHALREARDNLLSSLPAPICPIAAALAERAAMLALHLAAMDKAALQGGGLSPADARTYQSLSGHHSRLLRQLAGLGRGKPHTSALLAALAAAENAA